MHILVLALISICSFGQTHQAPGRPRIVHISHIKPRSFVVQWEAPATENGPVRSYLLQYSSYSVVQSKRFKERLKDNFMSAKISGLEPYTKYRVSIRAENNAGYGENSALYPVITDVEGPSAPTTTNCSVLSTNYVYVQWSRPKTFYRGIESYIIKYSSETGAVSGKRRVNGDMLEATLTDLQANHSYTVKIAGTTKSIYYNHEYVGGYSKANDCFLPF